MQLTHDVLKTLEAIEDALYSDADDDIDAPNVWRGVLLLTLTFVLVGVALWAGV